MRLPLATDLKTRTGAPDKDARLKNCYVESKGPANDPNNPPQTAVRKRPIAQGGIAVGTGTAQGGIGLNVNGVPYFFGFWSDVLYPYFSTGTTWSAGAAYNIGDMVSFGFVNYWARTANTNSQPPNSNWSSSFVPAVPSIPFSLWTSRTLNASGLYDALIYGTKFIASAVTSTSYQYSTDGISWATGSNANGISSCAYGSGIYVATGNGGFGNTYATSSDGISWTTRTLPATFLGGIVSYANGTFFVASTTIAGNSFVTSANGTTWSAITSTIADIGTSGVIYGNGVYVSCDFNGFTKPFYYSSNGTTWTQATVAPNASNIEQMAFGNGIFLVIYSFGSYATSTDGITWTNRSLPTNAYTNLTFGNGYFCATQDSFSYTSTDGISWTAVSFPLSGTNLMRVAYGNNKFVSVKYNSSQGATLT